MNSREKVQLWNWINEYVVTCGGDPSDTRHARKRREAAVVQIEQTVQEIVDRCSEEMRGKAAEAVKHLSHEDGVGMGSQRIEGAILSLPTEESGEHDWLLREWSYSHGTQIQVCRKCGIVRRADDGNKPCRGKVKVEIR